MTNLIEERNERTKERKKRKKKMDSLITLSNDTEKQVMTLTSKMSMSTSSTSIRLLDEGFCDNGFVLKKGTLEKYLNGQNEKVREIIYDDDGYRYGDVLNLTDDFVGNVNLGHMEFATFPFVIGEWNKNDLTLVDIENDRKALDVAVRLDEESVFVKELARQPYDIGVSAEFQYHINNEDTEELSEMMGEYMPVIDEIFIFAYGLVGECGNVNSSGLELKGETMSQVKKELMAEEEVKVNEEVAEEVTEEVTEEEVAEAEVIEEETKELDAESEEAEAEEEAEEESEDSQDESEEIEAGDSADDEESEEDEVDEVGSDSADDDEDEVDEAELSYAEVIERIESLTRENAELKEHIAALKKDKNRLDKKLKREYTAKEEFLAKTANLSAELFPNEGEAEKQAEEEAKKLAENRKYYKGDGIAD